MEGGESGGGLMEGRECWGWGMSPCVRGEAGTSSVVVPCWRPVVVAHRLLITCRILFACRILFVCRLPVVCRVLFACCLPVACRVLFAWCLPIACRLTCRLSLRVACLRVSLSSGAVHGWWCWVFVASRGAGPPSPFVAGGVATSLCRGRVVRCCCRCPWGGHSPLPSAHASAGLVCYPTVVLGLRTRSVRWGAMTTGWPLTFPSAHVMYMAWAICSFAIVLALSSWGSKRG